ncbi:hypothetical protein BTVI_121521 [Pitangus sulphuratus]|nr:hypothetical protein BTVI_121521 [Pitangus sulphuratus]
MKVLLLKDPKDKDSGPDPYIKNTRKNSLCCAGLRQDSKRLGASIFDPLGFRAQGSVEEIGLTPQGEKCGNAEKLAEYICSKKANWVKVCCEIANLTKASEDIPFHPSQWNQNPFFLGEVK